MLPKELAGVQQQAWCLRRQAQQRRRERGRLQEAAGGTCKHLNCKNLRNTEREYGARLCAPGCAPTTAHARRRRGVGMELVEALNNYQGLLYDKSDTTDGNLDLAIARGGFPLSAPRLLPGMCCRCAEGPSSVAWHVLPVRGGQADRS